MLLQKGGHREESLNINTMVAVKGMANGKIRLPEGNLVRVLLTPSLENWVFS